MRTVGHEHAATTTPNRELDKRRRRKPIVTTSLKMNGIPDLVRPPLGPRSYTQNVRGTDVHHKTNDGDTLVYAAALIHKRRVTEE